MKVYEISAQPALARDLWILITRVYLDRKFACDIMPAHKEYCPEYVRWRIVEIETKTGLTTDEWIV